jgi:hydrogenase maturation protease
MTVSSARTLIIGLGNPLLGDDAVGLRVAQELRHRLAGAGGIEVIEDYHGGLRLMERMVGYQRVLVVDAIVSGAEPGSLQVLRPDGRPTRRSASAHDVDLATALALGREAGAELPPDEAIRLLGIEAVEVESFSERLTPAVAAAVPAAVERALYLIRPSQEAP